MNEIHFDEQVDITDVVCPVTFVKAKVALEEMDEGQVLAVKMNDGEPVQNVPRSIKEEGHQILKLNTNDDGTYTILVNSNKPRDVQRQGILHELGHIMHDDMYSTANIDLIERMAHARQFDDVDGINFYTHIL